MEKSLKEAVLTEVPKKEPEKDVLKGLDDNALDGIIASLAAFQQQ